MQRVLEPEVMDTSEEAIEYDAMDFTEVNTAFAQRAMELGPQSGLILDAGTGTARIPILICQQCPQLRIIGNDLSKNMLLIGSKNVDQAGLQNQISLELGDSKQLPYQDGQFDMVISNSIVHHLPDPLPFFLEVKRVLKPNGAIFIRDLIRPDNEATMNAFVEKIGQESGYDERQNMLLRDSLHAAFRLDEVNELVQKAGLEGVKVYQSSDLHWTAERKYQ
ncbi:class I SAM-dependent methyltransferase [Nostoc sp. CENA67]|uniref:Class I SAM-dependent methyltransferase n=1 Tax=Amazonocrinis nigriterrae CENA67 TaxID=2794033 RepID=A0A8J7HTW9_9NOST|nr:class I SAM-dependent methyltransferase [Amazonocrinis nigriterrae]MBH8563432.1 class I SAM-dependent methyltransferase [Amazonocrinis nigriterrae CENA67]